MTAGDGLDRKAVRRRAEAATPGPWRWNSYDDGFESVRNELEGVLEPDGGESRYRAISVSDADAEFIGHARTDVPALLDALEAAEAEAARLREALDEAQLRSIEARNPGIDMDEVRRLRTEGGAS